MNRRQFLKGLIALCISASSVGTLIKIADSIQWTPKVSSIHGVKCYILPDKLFDKLADYLEAQQRFASAQLLRLGHENIMYNGVPVIKESDLRGVWAK